MLSSRSSSSFLSIMWIASIIIVLTLQVIYSSITVDASSNKLAFFTKKKTYTPLLFFKVPKGTMDECDNMEKVIKSLEKEQSIQVQRLDIQRDRSARKLYEKLVEGNTRSPFPLLYHRESLQRIYGSADVDLVRSWSKGRLLPNVNDNNEKEVTVLGGPDQDGEGDDDLMNDNDIDMEELEMEMDAELTPMQRRGKEAMKRRMEEGRKK